MHEEKNYRKITKRSNFFLIIFKSYSIKLMALLINDVSCINEFSSRWRKCCYFDFLLKYAFCINMKHLMHDACSWYLPCRPSNFVRGFEGLFDDVTSNKRKYKTKLIKSTWDTLIKEKKMRNFMTKILKLFTTHFVIVWPLNCSCSAFYIMTSSNKSLFFTSAVFFFEKPSTSK